MSWINHLPPACWSTFRKSNSKQQLGCRFDIMDYESYFFVFWHMQLYMSWYIISFFGFTFLNILIFSSTLVLTSSYRRNLYTFYHYQLARTRDVCRILGWSLRPNTRVMAKSFPSGGITWFSADFILFIGYSVVVIFSTRLFYTWLILRNAAGLLITAIRATLHPCMGLQSARCSNSGGSTWRLQSVCKLLAKLLSTSPNIPPDKWKPDPSVP